MERSSSTRSRLRSSDEEAPQDERDGQADEDHMDGQLRGDASQRERPRLEPGKRDDHELHEEPDGDAVERTEDERPLDEDGRLAAGRVVQRGGGEGDQEME